MPELSAVNHPTLADWRAESLRMTALLSSTAQESSKNSWEALLGEPPENRNIQPRTGIQQEEGAFAGGRLLLMIQPARIDWLLNVDINQATPGELPSIDSASNALNSFVDLMLQWLEVSPALQRLAFGFTLFLPQKDVQAAYSQIPSLFPLNKFDLKNAQDFNYQINRPRNSIIINDLRINRLSKWSIVTLSTVSLGMGASMIMTPLQSACKLELDINNIPNSQGELPKEKLSQLFQELVDLGKEIAIEGDIL